MIVDRHRPRRHGVTWRDVAHAGRKGLQLYQQMKRAKRHQIQRTGRFKAKSYARPQTKVARRNWGGQLGSQTGVASDTGMSFVKRHFRTKKRFMRGLRKILAPQFLQSVCQTRISTPIGTQGVFDVQAYTGSGAGTSTGPVLLGQQDTRDMQSILGLFETSAGSTANTRRMMVKSAVANYRIRSATNMPIKITLYDCWYRRDRQGTLLLPSQAWANGLLNENVTILGNPNNNSQGNTFAGATPFQSQLFCQVFKVAKVTKFTLHAGSEHMHRVSIKPGGTLSQEYTSNWFAYKGLSYVLMAVIEGPVIQDSTAPFNVSYGIAEADIICETKYNFTALERSRTGYTQYSTLPLSLTTPQGVTEDTDLVTPVAVV